MTKPDGCRKGAQPGIHGRAVPGSAAPETAHFVFLLVENFSHLAFSCALEPLRIANLVSGEELYRWSLISEDGKTAVCSNRSVTLADRGLEPLDRHDRLYVISGLHVQDRISAETLNFLRREKRRGVAIGAICSGAYVLAKAGFLDGVETAIHWEYHDLFMEKFPEVRLVRNVFVANAPHVTASGGTAAADLMLHLIARDHGAELAATVADQMVYNAVREGTAAQTVSLQSRHGMRNEYLVRAIRIMQDHIEEPLAPQLIAREIGISARQLERLFGKYLNTTPKRYSMELRLDRARRLILQSEDSLSQIAMSCGFTSTSHFSKAFRMRFGVSPIKHRSKLS